MNLFLLLATSFVAVALILVILIQNPKTGTLNPAVFSQSIKIAPASKLIETTTWRLAVLMFVLCLTFGVII